MQHAKARGAILTERMLEQALLFRPEDSLPHANVVAGRNACRCCISLQPAVIIFPCLEFHWALLCRLIRFGQAQVFTGGCASSLMNKLCLVTSRES